jgi:hypothetical protein
LFNDYERKFLNRFSLRYHLVSSQQSLKNNQSKNQQCLPALVHVALETQGGGGQPVTRSSQPGTACFTAV